MQNLNIWNCHLQRKDPKPWPCRRWEHLLPWRWSPTPPGWSGPRFPRSPRAWTTQKRPGPNDFWKKKDEVGWGTQLGLNCFFLSWIGFLGVFWSCWTSCWTVSFLLIWDILAFGFGEVWYVVWCFIMFNFSALLARLATLSYYFHLYYI